MAGTWTVSGGSLAGYRVRDRLAGPPAESDAVGRTSDVSGSITIESDGTTTTLTKGTLTVANTTIASGLPDFDIVVANVAGFIPSIADQGALEFAVNFVKG